MEYGGDGGDGGKDLKTVSVYVIVASIKWLMLRMSRSVRENLDLILDFLNRKWTIETMHLRLKLMQIILKHVK